MRHLLASILLASSFSIAADPVPPAAGYPAISPSPGGKKTDRVFMDGVRLGAGEFELLTLTGFTGPTTWDVTTTEGVNPVKWFELKPEESVIGVRVGSNVPDRHASPKEPTIAVYRLADGKASVAAWGVKDGKPMKLATFAVDANVGPRPPPPKPVDPVIPDPVIPVPAASFRVIFAVESGDTLTPAQNSIIYGVAVENWLLKNCTGGKDGFRRRDKDNPNVTGKELSEIWAAARQSITRTPCAIVEKNNHIEIIALEETPQKMIDVFNEYLTGKRGK